MVEENVYRARLERYLECEGLLREFFDQVGCCSASHCLTLGDQSARCCGSEYYSDDYSWQKGKMNPVFRLLIRERVSKYGSPDGDGYCGYHTEKGCRLKSHRSTTCIAFTCPGLENRIRVYYGIDYEWGSIKGKLQRVLEGEFSPDEFRVFRGELKEIIERVKKGPVSFAAARLGLRGLVERVKNG